MPAAPGLFSITTAWPQASCSFCARMRVPMSVPPPGGKGTTMRIGLAGHACADAASGHASSAMAANTALSTAPLRSDTVDVEHRWYAVVGKDDFLAADSQPRIAAHQAMRGAAEKHVLGFLPRVVDVDVEA